MPKKYFNYFLLGVVAFFPWVNYFVRKFHLPFSNSWDDAFIFFVFVISLVIGAKNIKKLFSNPTFLFGLLFLSVTLFSFYFNNYFLVAYSHEARLFFEPFLIFVALMLIEPEKEEVHFFLKSIIVSYSFLALYGLYQYVKKVPTPPQWVDKDLEKSFIKTRAFSIIGSPNVLGAHLEVALPLPLIYIIKEKSRIKKVLWSIPFLIIGGGLLATFARAAWLSSAFSLFASALWISPLLGVIFIIFAGILFVFISPLRIRILSLFSSLYIQKSAQDRGRIFRWTYGVLNASDHPLLGSGFGTYGGSASQAYGFFAGQSMDSVYIKTLAETGWLGILTFIPWVSLGVGVILTRFMEEKKPLFLFIGAGLVAFLLNMFTENLLNNTAGIAYVFWALIAVGITYRE